MSTPANDPGIAFELDDELVAAQPGETIWSAARRHGVLIPHLCHSDGLRPDGNCRACVVEIEGERTLAPSCCRTPAPGQKVRAQSPRARKSQDLVLELLLADLPEQGHKWNGDDAALPHGELSAWAARQGVTPRASLTALRREPPRRDLSHPAMAVNLDACIQCNRCQRACREAQGNDVIGLAFRGAHTQVVFDLADPMGASSCVACGECVQACPTGALMPKSLIGSQKVDRSVDSVCPFCGIGCQITYKVRDEKIVAVDGRPGPANEGRLCVKGRFGFDYAHHPARLTKPLIRKAGVTKDPDHLHRDLHWSEVFREASWDEALDFAAASSSPCATPRQEGAGRFRLRQGQQRRGLPVPEAGAHRLRQQQRRPLHPPVPCLQCGRAARRRRLGRGEQPGARRGAGRLHPRHRLQPHGQPPGGRHLDQERRRPWREAGRGRPAPHRPRPPRLARAAVPADTDVALLNAMLHVIVTEGLSDEAFIRERTSTTSRR
jgi:formate dehydrogenase major subunit